MKRLLVVAIVVGLILALGVTIYAFDGPSSADLWIDGTGAPNIGNPMFLNSQDTGGGCVTHTGTIYLQWNISSIAGEPVADKSIGTANISLTTGGFSANPTQSTLTLYSTAGDGDWDDTGATTVPAIGDALSDATLAAGNLPVGTNIAFPSTSELVQYLNEQSSSSGIAGDDDDIVTFAVQFSACSSTIQQIQDNTTGDDAPFMSLLNPTNVTLTSLQAETPSTPSTNWGLYAGLAGLAVLGLGAVGYGYSRTR